MNYALVEDGVVTNVIWLYPANASDFPSAVPMGDVPATIGDTWDGEHFYRNGERVLTFAEQVLITMYGSRAYMDGRSWNNGGKTWQMGIN